MTLEKETAALWQDYLFLTRELLKFLGKEQDEELVQELLRQREQLQRAIDARQDDSFRCSEAGRALLQEIAGLNRQGAQKLQLAMNRLRQQQQLSRAYDQMESFVGGLRFDTTR